MSPEQSTSSTTSSSYAICDKYGVYRRYQSKAIASKVLYELIKGGSLFSDGLSFIAMVKTSVTVEITPCDYSFPDESED